MLSDDDTLPHPHDAMQSVAYHLLVIDKRSETNLSFIMREPHQVTKE